MFNRPGRLLSLFVAALAGAGAQVVNVPRARIPQISVKLEPETPSPAPVGTIVSFDATVSQAGAGPLWYRFRVRPAGGEFRTVRDYGLDSTLDWTASEQEGAYEMEVSVQDKRNRQAANASLIYQFSSRVSGGQPVISPTEHPLVFLYSAPPCPAGSRMRVRFEAPGASGQTTPYKPCSQGLSMNFYLAGMQLDSRYAVRHTVDSGSVSADGPVLDFATASVSPLIAGYSVTQPPPVPAVRGILLQSTLLRGPVATDLYGNLLWYYRGSITLTNPETGGSFFGVVQDPLGDTSHQLVRQFDLAGMTIRETNAARVNEQLALLGKRQIGSFHHEARGLPDGKILVLASTERILTDVQDEGPVDVIGDMILVLDRDLQVVWAWDTFDHLDPSRRATLEEVCLPMGGGCPTFYLAPRANDWVHGNSLQLTPDGNILYSARHRDWIIKIDYNNGAGSGAILWRLGKEGDFRIDSADPSPWFSHQHDAQFERGDNSTLIVFDNGNVRRETDDNANSRGQVLRLDEANRTATLLLNADLGDYSRALGAAQRLPNGNYHFDLGLLPNGASRSVEVDPAGKIVYDVQVPVSAYRTFRMWTLYTP